MLLIPFSVLHEMYSYESLTSKLTKHKVIAETKICKTALLTGLVFSPLKDQPQLSEKYRDKITLYHEKSS